MFYATAARNMTYRIGLYCVPTARHIDTCGEARSSKRIVLPIASRKLDVSQLKLRQMSERSMIFHSSYISSEHTLLTSISINAYARLRNSNAPHHVSDSDMPPQEAV